MDTGTREAQDKIAASGIRVIVHGTAWHPQQREIQVELAGTGSLKRAPTDMVICSCACVDNLVPCNEEATYASAAPPLRDS